MISLLVTLVIVGVVLYLLNALVPMDGRIKMVINVLVCLFLFLYLLDVLGLWSMPALRR